MTKIAADIQVAKAKAELLKVQVEIKDFENKLNPPANPLEQLMAAGIIPPNSLPRGPVAVGQVPAGQPAISPQQLQASLPALLAPKNEEPPKLLTIRGQDNRLEAVFETEEGKNQIIAKVGDELPGKWKVRDITYNSVGVVQAGKSENLMIKPGDYLPVRYSEPKGKAPVPAGAKPTPLAPAGKEPAGKEPAAKEPAGKSAPKPAAEKKPTKITPPKSSSPADDDSRNG